MLNFWRRLKCRKGKELDLEGREIRIVLNEEDFTNLISGKEVIKRDCKDSLASDLVKVRMILQDIGFSNMSDIILKEDAKRFDKHFRKNA